jgi:hypothetical protein
VTVLCAGAPYGAEVTDEGTRAARPAVASQWASRLDSGSLLYGTIVSAAALAVGEAGSAAVLGAILAALLVSLHVH